MKFGKSTVLSCILAMLALVLAGAANDAAAQNLLMNPGFETGDLSNWEAFGLSPNSAVTVESPDNGDSLPGMNNAYLNNRAEAIALGIKQPTGGGSAAPGTYYYSFDLKLEEAGVGAVFFCEIFAEKAAGGIASQILLGPFFPPQGVWTNYQGTFVAGPDTDFLTMQFAAITGAVVGSASVYRVDNAYLGTNEPVANEAMSWGDAKALFR